MKPLINIVTRTSRRPIGFKKCRESITEQTYDNINHIIMTDDRSSQHYLEDAGVNFTLLDKCKINTEADRSIPPPQGKGFFPHNLYLNIANDLIKEGWLMYLDDDDYLANSTVIEQFVDHIHTEDTLYYWKMEFSNGRIIPHHTCFNNQPIPCRIGGSCFCVHSKWKEYIKWDSWQMSDYRVLCSLHKNVPKKEWLDIIVVKSHNSGGGGKCEDIA